MARDFLSDRPCPVCGCHKCDVVHKSVVTVVCCNSCGMVYNDATEDVDYSRSKYTVGFEEWNQERYDETGDRIESLPIKSDASILDVGCATGGLMRSLEKYGFTNLNGIDPSPECIKQARACELDNGHYRIGTLNDTGCVMPVKGKWDVVILSHVLEHIRDVRAAMQKLREIADSVYIEVPDSQRYADNEVSPGADFNKEHVNHFDMQHLQMVFETYGFVTRACGEYNCNPNNSPAIWAYFSRTKTLRSSVARQVDRSVNLLQSYKNKLSLIKGSVVVWGIGQLSLMIEEVVKGKVVAAVDSYAVGTYAGVPIQNPAEAIFGDFPIVVASVLHFDAISAKIRDMGLTNQVVTLL